jgi:hypothetical protein
MTASSIGGAQAEGRKTEKAARASAAALKVKATELISLAMYQVLSGAEGDASVPA